MEGRLHCERNLKVYEDPAFSTGREQAVLVFLWFLRLWEGAVSPRGTELLCLEGVFAGPGCLVTPCLVGSAAEFSEKGRAYGQGGVAGGKSKRTTLFEVRWV